MGRKFKFWKPRSQEEPSDYSSLSQVLFLNRNFHSVSKLEYGDHGLEQAFQTIAEALRQNRRIALYADYDVDGTMSCVSWIWFLQSIGFNNFVHHIPDRSKEGYGVNLQAVRHLVEDEKAQLIITMDTGITANEEASWCRQRGVEFICTDHHKVQIEKMPDCIILNPKLHPEPTYQELCGCGITFVLLRKLGHLFPPAPELWTDILALTGMATICDVVPLNGVNHRLAQAGVQALWKSKRPVLQKLLKASAASSSNFDERDVGFRLGPRINAVGRLDHADKVIEAFVGDDVEPLIKYMNVCNERRKKVQARIVEEAAELAETYRNDPILFLGGDWHAGVVGIAASKIAETYWKPTWLFQKAELCKGSARSIPHFDVTNAMSSAKAHFTKFGGHKAAGGFSFPLEKEEAIREQLLMFAEDEKRKNPDRWESVIYYDCALPMNLAKLDLTDHLSSLRPFGHGFEEPVFKISARIHDVRFYNDKDTGKPKHTAVFIEGAQKQAQKIMFFNEVHQEIAEMTHVDVLVTASRQQWQGRSQLSLIGCDYAINT
ncbi:MAG: DHH family phosphoesterase [Deltaproteobacteria bacterium]|nr:DHH family phosphoesterase [Deltaproteobacteria bacterium]